MSCQCVSAALAFLLIVAAPTLAQQGADRTLDEPVGVRFTLEDGVEVRGRLASWNSRSFDGTFGRRKWTELQHDDLWRVFRQVMSQNDAGQWVELGHNLLLISERQPKALPFAERAFTRALDLDESTAAAIEQARADVREAHRVAKALREAIADARLRTETPERGDWPTDRWPILNEQAQADATADCMQRAEEILRRAGHRIRPFESERFLVYSRLDAEESIRWIRQLEALYRHMARQLGINPEGNVFHGKAIVFLWEDRDRYRLIEADAFKQLVSKKDIAMTHYEDAYVFINAVREPYDPEFASALLTHAALGVLHRYISPIRLPAWANHGYASLAAMQVLDDSWNEYELRRRGLRFIREGGNLDAAMAVDYDSEQWPGPQMVIPAIGLLTVELMQQEQPRRFARWVAAIKEGDDWTGALKSKFGTDRRALATTTARYFQVND